MSNFTEERYLKYLEKKWFQHRHGVITDKYMHYVFGLVERNTGIHFVDLLIYLGGDNK